MWCRGTYGRHWKAQILDTLLAKIYEGDCTPRWLNILKSDVRMMMNDVCTSKRLFSHTGQHLGNLKGICVLFGSDFRPWLGIVMMLMFCDLCTRPESHRWPQVVCWLLFFSMFLVVFCLWQFIHTFEHAARGRSWKIGLEHEFPFGCCCFTDLCENFRAMWVLMALTLNLSHLKSPSENDPRSRFVSYELEHIDFIDVKIQEIEFEDEFLAVHFLRFHIEFQGHFIVLQCPPLQGVFCSLPGRLPNPLQSFSSGRRGYHCCSA